MKSVLCGGVGVRLGALVLFFFVSAHSVMSCGTAESGYPEYATRFFNFFPESIEETEHVSNDDSVCKAGTNDSQLPARIRSWMIR